MSTLQQHHRSTAIEVSKLEVVHKWKYKKYSKEEDLRWDAMVQLTHDGLSSCLEDSLDGECLGFLGGCCMSGSFGRGGHGQLLVRQPGHHQRGSLALGHQLRGKIQHRRCGGFPLKAQFRFYSRTSCKGLTGFGAV